jgi:uncharacterized protein YgbK (DUF1537 family)
LSPGTITKVLILADDLTGAADSAAAFLGRAHQVAVHLDAGSRPGADVAAIDLDTRSRSERLARQRVRRAFGGRAARRAAILFKKVDSTLRGHVAAELAAVRAVLGRRPVIFAPAFPAQGRSVREAHLLVKGKPASGDLRALLARAGFPATHLASASAAGLRAALSIGSRAFVCDAKSDADLDRIARAGLALRPRPLFVGSAGLARALARALPRRRPASRGPIPVRAVLTVVGSAAAASVQQARRLARDRAALLVQIAWKRAPTRREIPVVRRLGRTLAQAMPPMHYVLTGGETARAVLGARGIGEFRLLGEVEPGVPFGMAQDGTLICTKAGGFGRPETLRRCVARLQREMKGR